MGTNGQGIAVIVLLIITNYISIMVYCILNGENANVQHTHANNQGIVTVFFNRGNGNVSPSSYSIEDHATIEDFLVAEYGATILEKYNII